MNGGRADAGRVARAVRAVRSEVDGALGALGATGLDDAAELLADRGRRWFFCGQGRSGLVAAMVAMRLMHLGVETHVVGEATTPAIDNGDGLMAISGSGETATTVHLARRAHEFGARVLAVTARADSSLAAPAHAVVELSTPDSRQFGNTLFDQCALLVLDGLAMALADDDPDAPARMHARHANLQ